MSVEATVTTLEKLSILVVDDRPENLASMQQLLRRPGLEILTAASGNEALSTMLDHDLALVLLDVQMPGMDGFEVAELMRRNERTRHVPIIFVTAINKERRQVFTGYEAGAVDYLFKPVDPFIIRSKVGVFLEMKQSQLARERLVRELNQAYNRLQKLSDRKTDYLSAASHELRTPLAVIKEYCNLVHDGVVGDINDDQRHCMSVALRNCNRLARLVDDVLDLDAIESGEFACSRREVRLDVLLAACHEDFRECCAARGQRLHVEHEQGMPTVLADPALTTQVLVNLLGNAHKFTPAGGDITLRAFVENGMARIEVVDTGPGIAQEDQRRVFEKFAQAEAPGSAELKSSGLGLAICRRIVGLLGGELAVTSVPGEGATFHFTLPLYTAERHLVTFVADGTRSEDRSHDVWSLVLLRRPRDRRHDKHLLTVVERVMRRGVDRTTTFELVDRPHVAVLLAANRDGALSFLARVEEAWEKDGDLQSEVEYAVFDLPAPVRNDFALPEDGTPFQPLGLEFAMSGDRCADEENAGG